MEYLIINITERQVTAARFELSGRSRHWAGLRRSCWTMKPDLAAVAAKIAEGISGSPRVVLCLPPALFAQRVVELAADGPAQGPREFCRPTSRARSPCRLKRRSLMRFRQPTGRIWPCGPNGPRLLMPSTYSERRAVNRRSSALHPSPGSLCPEFTAIVPCATARPWPSSRKAGFLLCGRLMALTRTNSCLRPCLPWSLPARTCRNGWSSSESRQNRC